MELKELLQEILDKKASDLHLTVGVPPVFRINGALTYSDRADLMVSDLERLAKQLLGTDKEEVFKAQGEADFSYNLSGVGYFRVNVYRQRRSMGIAIRLINTEILTLQELKIPAVVSTMTRRNQGLILVTGPAGSGKSTTLAAMTDLINTEKQKHIITLEDPIEYIHKHKQSIVTQREIGKDSLSFPAALRAALRQDPDVIVVGEMRDLETISIAVSAAETGHLVMATLHTSGSGQSVERIIDSFPSNQQHQIRIQLANSLIGVISQRLVPYKDNNSRIAATEIMVCTNAIRNLIREKKIHQINSMIQTGAKQGMQTMDGNLHLLYQEGMISRETALEYAVDSDWVANITK